MARLIAVLRWMIAFATVILLTTLAWQCIDVYLSCGQFTMGEAAARLAPLKWPAAIYTLAITIALIFSHKTKYAPINSSSDTNHRSSCITHSLSKRATAYVRLFLCIVSIALIVLGICNGGLFDVLVKAINICTECIGLG